MTTAVAQPAQNGRHSLITTMAAKYNLEPAKFFQTIKATVFSSKGTEEELIAFLTVANRYDLDPFCGEVFAFPKKGGGIQAVVGVDGWSSILNSQPAMDGMEFTDHLDDQGKLTAVTCRIYRKDRKHPTECTEYMTECMRGTEPWRQWPRRMLRHKATIQCARLAFGLSGIIDPDEAERFEAAGAVAGKVQESKLNDLLAAMPAKPPVTDEVVDEPAPDDINQDNPDSDPTDAEIADAELLIELKARAKELGCPESDIQRYAENAAGYQDHHEYLLKKPWARGERGNAKQQTMPMGQGATP